MKRISKHSIRLTGDDARQFLATLMSDDQLIDQYNNNPHLSTDQKSAFTAELLRRDLLPGNWTI